MRITVRLIVALAAVVAAVASFSAYLQVSHERDRQQEDIERRSRVLAQSLEEAIEPALEAGGTKRLLRLVEKFGNRERLAGVAVYDDLSRPLAVTRSLSNVLPAAPEDVASAIGERREAGRFVALAGKAMYRYVVPLGQEEKAVGALAIFHDVGYIQAQLSRIRRHSFFRALIQTFLISLVTVLMMQWSIVGPIARTAEWMKRLRMGESPEHFSLPKEHLIGPLASEVTNFAKHLSAAKKAAQEEAKLRQAADSLWTPGRLKEQVLAKLKGKPLFVVSNREPYMHCRRGRKIEAIVPAGGLVTALDPVLKACGGTWIAHGAGDADWDVADRAGRLKVPPEDPHYTLRRVAISKEVEQGYYYGFSNEGLWPLCHIAHARPLFRAEDWASYQQANAAFCKALEEELGGQEEPCVLIQDYHFALLPRMIKERRPDARVAIFWHIPWPNPEAFGICPWQRELLHGMLGADLIGFHTQFHCNNYLDTVDRSLECRIDWERFSVTKGGHATLVKAFPISVAVPAAEDYPPERRASSGRLSGPFKEYGTKVEFLGVGVERMDYTKGILERLKAIERFLEKYPAYQGRFSFVQLGAPSRTHIKRYHDFLAEVEAETERINWRFQSKGWKPILFLKKHHSHQEILPFFQNAHLCMVTSLHDGMNLVAKEFVASRDDEGGALILSQFTGASMELRDAIIVNPYDVEQTADAMRFALEMDGEEKKARMRRMRETVKEHNIYRWAGNLIGELSALRLEGWPSRSAS